jgi:phage/plasmid-associated DNA primase
VIDLRSGEIRSYTRSDYIIRVSGVEVDPKAKCPRWEQFIKAARGASEGGFCHKRKHPLIRNQ